jgi:hypothetical protein
MPAFSIWIASPTATMLPQARNDNPRRVIADGMLLPVRSVSIPMRCVLLFWQEIKHFLKPFSERNRQKVFEIGFLKQSS